MKKRPFLAIAISLVLTGIAMSFPLQVMLQGGHSLSEPIGIFSKLTILNLAVVFFALLTALHSFQMSPRIKWSVPVLMALIAWNNAVVGLAGLNASFAATQGATVAFAAFCSVFLLDPYRSVLTQPTRRWWRTPARIRMNIPLVAHSPRGLSLQAQSYDISKTGIFIKVKRVLRDASSEDVLRSGRVLDLKLQINHIQSLNLRAEVVRNVGARGVYPSGVGLRFLALSSYQKRLLGDLLDRRIQLDAAA